MQATVAATEHRKVTPSHHTRTHPHTHCKYSRDTTTMHILQGIDDLHGIRPVNTTLRLATRHALLVAILGAMHVRGKRWRQAAGQ